MTARLANRCWPYGSVGSAVDPDKPFDGTRTNNPNLEYGFSVTAGSFEVNGVTVNVSASDTVNAVLNRITQSAAGVTATFDAATETVLLNQKTQGETPTIVLSNDTSGFVQAMKLASAVPVPGTDADPDKTFATVSQFASIQSGTIIQLDLNSGTTGFFDATGPRFRTDCGVEFEQDLMSALGTHVDGVNDLFLGPNSSAPRGLIARLTSVLDELERPSVD